MKIHILSKSQQGAENFDISAVYVTLSMYTTHLVLASSKSVLKKDHLEATHVQVPVRGRGIRDGPLHQHLDLAAAQPDLCRQLLDF